jgi:hypothetical protein
MTQYQQSTTRKQLCKWLGLSRSVSYYKARNGKPGAKASQVTMKLDGSLVPNEDVVIHIRKLIDTEFNAFGYEYATHEEEGVPAYACQWPFIEQNDSTQRKA